MSPDEDGLPLVARSARALGVRVPTDIEPDEDGYVHRNTGGMSVAPDAMLNLPNHRRPRAFGKGSTGRNEDIVYSLEKNALEAHRLHLEPDHERPKRHATIEPIETMKLMIYEDSLAATRSNWIVAWQAPNS